jgi:hypothetical protein
MDKFLTWDFAGMVLSLVILLILHEYGHYLAYRILGYKAVVRKSFLVPGIDPQSTIEVKRIEGLLIALGGFIFSTVVVVLPLLLVNYKHWLVVMIGSVAGSIVDFIWALGMLFQRTVTISSRC